MTDHDGTAYDYPPIGDYAVIGDCRSAALISREGSLDWLCLPRFDSPAIFAALLDRQNGGRFRIRPTGAYETSRRYVGETNVLETTFRTEGGVLRLRDLMPVTAEEDKRRELWPNHQVLRQMECAEGTVEVEVLCNPRPDFGRAKVRPQDRGALGFRFAGAPGLLLRSEVPLRSLTSEGPGVGGRATLEAGERRYVSLTYNLEEPAVVPPFGEMAERKVRQTLRWWEDWVARCSFEGPYRDDVIRSALTLKLMTYAPSGAVIAAPTTSLPESIGGERNWDYRFCWLRDASLILQALMDLGYTPEGEAFLAWLFHAIQRTAPDVRVMYDVFGETPPGEQALDHLEGYAGSRPVRIGNDAADQFQLDTYGELVDAACQFVRRGGHIDREMAGLLVGLGKTACERWEEPDEGIWEVRAGRRHHTHSKVMCWVALDRLLELHEGGHVQAPKERFTRVARKIRDAVESRGYDQDLDSYVSVFDGQELDASLLLLELYGFTDRGDERMRRTCERIYERLGRGPLLYRYRNDDGLASEEGAFGIASFWGVETRARAGDVERAREDFGRLCGHANDVGLFAEEIDPESGVCLGNFPQAFTHVGLISAALSLRNEEEPS